jgi:branched-chain amino acid transport system ATP-binding protein
VSRWGLPGFVRHELVRQLLVEHDVELVAGFTSRNYVLDFGRMIIDGPTHDLLGSDEARAAYLGDLDLEAAQ